MSLLSDVNANKQAFQKYRIKHGIETLIVKIPVQEAQAFEQEFEASDIQKIGVLKTLISTHGGSIVE